MDGSEAKKSTSLETLVIQNITNVNDLKAKLNDIIKAGKDYEFDVSSCLKSLLNNSDQEIVLLTIQAISELAKSEDKRETYAQKEIIEPILNVLSRGPSADRIELIRQGCRALGNLCCDCDAARRVILESNGVPTLVQLLSKLLQEKTSVEDIKMFTCRTLLNYAIGGQEFSESIIQGDLISHLRKILVLELEKDDMQDDVVSTALLLFGVINDNTPEYLFEPEVNTAVLNILRETANIEISELCLEHLHAQAEHDSVKTLIAKEGGLQLVCSRLEQLVKRHEAGDLNADDSEVESVIKQACDLIIIVLTGDEAMHILYNKGVGEVYGTMVRWLSSPSPHLLTAAVLAVGNFARQDDYCQHLMEDKIFDRLLDLFETYHNFGVQIEKSSGPHPMSLVDVSRLQHAALSALRNLLVPAANKRVASARGRAAPTLLRALPTVKDHYVAYKLLAAVRMLVDGQESVASQLARDRAALAAVASWGHAGQHAGAAGEAPRLLAWSVAQLRHTAHWRCIVEVDGCVSCLVNMTVTCHSVMQNEAILALTLLAIESLKDDQRTGEFDHANSFISQLLKSEIGKHISVLIETNCAKMPVQVAENLLAFLDITSKNQELASDYKETKVQDALQKLIETRKDFSDDMRSCILGILTKITDNSNKE